MLIIILEMLMIYLDCWINIIFTKSQNDYLFFILYIYNA